jgi:hypothetical protein
MNKAIEAAGYEIEGVDATEQEVIDCFLDYVDCGYFRGLTVDEAKQMIEDEEITIKEICLNILKVK